MEDYPNLIRPESNLPLGVQRHILAFARPRHPAVLNSDEVRSRALNVALRSFVKRAIVRDLMTQLEESELELNNLGLPVEEIIVDAVDVGTRIITFYVTTNDNTERHLEITNVFDQLTFKNSFAFVWNVVVEENLPPLTMRRAELPNIEVGGQFARSNVTRPYFDDLARFVTRELERILRKTIVDLNEKIIYASENNIQRLDFERTDDLLVVQVAYPQGNVSVLIDPIEFAGAFPEVAEELERRRTMEISDGGVGDDGCVIL